VADHSGWSLTIIIACVVVLTTFGGLSLPFLVNIPAVPVFFYKFLESAYEHQPQAETLTINQTRDILAHYDFENNFLKDGAVLDLSGNRNHAYVKGFTGSAPGHAGNFSVSFSNIFSGNGYIVSELDPAAGENNVTFSIWFRTGDPEGNYNIARAAAAGTGSVWMIGTRFTELWDENGETIRLPGTQIRDNRYAADEWTQRVTTYNGSRILDYTNGALVNDWPASGAAIGSGTEMVIGSWKPFGFNFAGQIDDFVIYNRVLGPDEITQLYQGDK
jgi:hypothetical protein